MIRVTVKWHTEATESLWQEVRARIAAATKFLWGKIREELGTPYPPASRPGQPPHKRTGKLQRGILYELDEKTMKSKVVIRDVPYAAPLEFGNRRVAARPFMLATVHKYFQQIKAIVEGTGKAA